MSRVPRGVLVAAAGAILIALTGCTPGVTQYWHLTADGQLSTAWCHNRTIESLTVTLVADDYSTVQTFTVEGPATFVEEGKPVSLQEVAPGWSAAPPIEIDRDWTKITLTSTSRETSDSAGSAERGELSPDAWITSPSPGLGVVSCELLD